MKAYIICVFSTLFINLIADKCIDQKKEKLGQILLVLSLFVLCYIAGVRDISIGTDIKGYVLRLSNVVASNNFIDYILMPNSHALFGVLVYVGYIFNDFNILLFVIELVVCIPVYIYAYKEKENCPITLNIMVFVLTMYCTSFNLVRQSIAISFCILAYHFYKNQLLKKAFVLVLVASLFHVTALVFFTVFLLGYTLKNKESNKRTYMLIFAVVLVVFMIFSEKTISITSYGYYLTTEKYYRSFSIGSIIKQVFFLCLAFFTKFHSRKNLLYKAQSEMSILLMAVSLVLVILSFSRPGTGRLGYYFFETAIFIIVANIYNNIKPKYIIGIILFVILFGLWMNTVVTSDSAGIYPYKSEVVQWLN